MDSSRKFIIFTLRVLAHFWTEFMDETEAVHHARDWAPSKALGLQDLQKKPGRAA
jgi:hypothetical protein